MIRIGIYGFTFTQKIIFNGGELVPLFDNLLLCKKNKVHDKKYVLSGFLIPEVNDYNGLSQLIFDLSAVLSFIEQKDVKIFGELEEDELIENLPENYPTKLEKSRRSGSGIVIMEDAFSPNGRACFIQLAMDKLNESVNNGGDAFRTAFFKSMLDFREPILYIDVNYYLMFSSLEAIARHSLQDFRPTKTPKIITDFLESHGFDVKKNEHPHAQRNIFHYCKLRHALFHNGVYKALLDESDPESVIYLEDYLSNLNRLLPLVFMKILNFDDGYINWDSWMDRQPFKRPSSNLAD